VDQPWTKLLDAAARGDGRALQAEGARLAHVVVSASVLGLAYGVLAGGPLAHANAIRLAERFQDLAEERRRLAAAINVAIEVAS
jgi:hypothetical protein